MIQDEHSAYGRLLHLLSRSLAIVAGFMLLTITLVILVSVLGRNILLTPIQGDFEIVGMLTAVAVFLSLPYCQLKDGNVRADFFLAHAPERVKAYLDATSAVIFALLASIFAWRMSLGLLDFVRYGDISQILAIPLWWVFPFAILAFTLLALNAAYQAALLLRQRRP